MPELKSVFLLSIKVGVDRLHDIGQVPLGGRHIDMLGAGSFEGPRLRGRAPGSGARCWPAAWTRRPSAPTVR